MTEKPDTRTPSPASPSPVAAGQIADLQARLARKVMELASLEYAVRHHLSDKSMGADIASILDNAMRCIFITHGNWNALSSQAPKPASAGGELWTVIDEARRIALAAADGMDMKHCSHLINAIKAYDASGCGPILNVAAEADTAKPSDRERAIADLRGKYKGKLSSVDEFLADRLAPIEARGVVTDADWVAAANEVFDCLIQQRTVKSNKPFNSYGDCVRTRAHELAALRARESAPAVESEPVAWMFTCKKPGKWMQYATIMEEDTNHWPLDQWTSVKKEPLYATPPSVATGCAGEVTEEMVDRAWDAFMGCDPSSTWAKLEVALQAALSQPARAAGES